MLIAENRWRTQRYGLDEGLVDFGKGAIIPYRDLLEKIIGMVGNDGDRLNCRTEIEAAAVRSLISPCLSPCLSLSRRGRGFDPCTSRRCQT